VKRLISLVVSLSLLLPVSLPASAANTYTVTQIDLVTQQGDGAYHPHQVGIERALQLGSKKAERLKMTPLPTNSTFAMAAVPGTRNVYISDRNDGSLWEVDPQTGKVFRRIGISSKPSTNIQGIATGLGEDIYVYYNGNGTIQRLNKNGQVLESFAAPTPYGHSLAYGGNNLLYLLDDRGNVFIIDAYSKQTVNSFTLKQPSGVLFNGANYTFSIFWDGKYWNIANAQDEWKLYRYDANWNYHDMVDLDQWSMTAVVWNGSGYWTLKQPDNNRIFTFRMSDAPSGDVDRTVTDNYQYIGNLLTTSKAAESFPRYDDRNIALLYNDPVKVTQDLLRPYVAYIDGSGKRAGQMFDSFLFLPSGASDKKFHKETDPAVWSSYIRQSVEDIATLDKEWGEKNSEMKTDGKAKVFLSVPYPNPNDSLERRKEVIQNYLDEAYRLINGRKFANIEFRGFYWHHEYAEFQEPIVVEFNAMVHRKGLLSLWIPYFPTDAAINYQALGFDEVFHQPNYYFVDEDLAPNLNRFFTVTDTGVRYAKGVEIELDHNLAKGSRTHIQLFNDYLHYGLVQGFLGGSKAWYDNWTISQLYKNGSPLYEKIHKVIDGRYSESNVPIHSPVEGSLHASASVNLPGESKIRLNVITDKPYNVQKVFIHFDQLSAAPQTYIGDLRVDEELVLSGGKLVKQEIGLSKNGLHVGFNVPLKNVQITFIPTGRTPFADIAVNNPAAQSILELSNKGILNGMMQDGKLVFQPKGAITRAQFAVLLSNAYRLKAKRNATYGDAANAWFSPYVAAVSESDYMKGYDAYHFAPDDSITQEQVIAILVRILNYKGIHAAQGEVSFYNQDLASGWAQETLQEGRKLNLFTDKFGDTRFHPQEKAARADVAIVLTKALGLLN